MKNGVNIHLDLVNHEEDKLSDVLEQSARLAMAFDMIHELIGILNEEGVIEKFFILFSKLFAPKSIFFKSLNPNKSKIYRFPRNIELDEKIKTISINDLKVGEPWKFEENNLYLGISFYDRILGILILQDLAFPDQISKYIYPALIISKVCGLAINNARIHREHSKTLDNLKNAMEELKELDHLKSMFLASMSHELRTPLNAIMGFTIWILMGMEGDLNEEQRKQLNFVKSNAEHLLTLINDILDISKIEAGKIELVIGEFLISEVIVDVANSIFPLAKEKGLEFIYDISEEIIINSDKRRIKQILMNLLSNAIKFTLKGSVKIKVNNLSKKTLEIIVEDTGIGMEEKNLKKLFQPFHQLDISSKKEYEGTGLGLYLCKRLLNLLHGEISVKSQLGTGSQFKFNIPINFKKEG